MAEQIKEKKSSWTPARQRYGKEVYPVAYRKFTMGFKRGVDDEVIKKLESMENTTDYVRKLILADIKENS